MTRNADSTLLRAKSFVAAVAPRRAPARTAACRWAAACRCLAAGAAMLLAGSAAAASLTPAEEAGRKIYMEGLSPSGGSIEARLGFGGFDVPASAVPCASCHGPDGLGRPEGGVVPPNIQWSELTKAYGHVHPTGRKHPAFTDRTVKKAFTFGVDPAGNDLDVAMPRYRMSDEDAASVVAYLKHIEFVLPPGVSAKVLRIGTVLPAAGRFAETGSALRKLLEAWFARINDNGGLYGRKLELVIADYGDSPDTAYANAWKLISEGDVFLLLAPFTAGWEARLDRMARDERLPVVAPVTLFPEDTRASNLYVFHMLSGIAELAQVLAGQAAALPGLKEAPVLVLHAAGGSDLAQAMTERLGELGFGAVLAPASFGPGGGDVAALARMIADRQAGALFVLGPGLDLTGLARAADALGARPYLFVPGPLAPADIFALPAAYRDRVFLSYPTLPADQRPAALEDYAALIGGQPAVRPAHLAQAYAATLAAVKVLKDIGRDLDREKFRKGFESLSGFDTGMLPPLSYNSDRRIGALGGYVVAVDLAGRSLRPSNRFLPLPVAAQGAPATTKESGK